MNCHRLSGLVVLAGLALACRGNGTGPSPGRGSFSASWVGSDTGKLSGRPIAVFCGDGNRLELMAMQGDAGIGLAVYPAEEITDGNYDGFDPGTDTVRRPGVTAAARWFTEREVAAYQSDWGALKLKRRGNTLSGGFAIHLRKVGADTDTIMVQGKFTGVLPGPCPEDSVPSLPPPPSTAQPK
jgi:hypothetical protein